MPQDAPPPAKETGSPWLGWGLVAVTGFLFWPVARWMVTEVAAREQIKQGMVLLLAAAALIIWRNPQALRPVPNLNNRSLGLLAGAFACVGIAGFTHWSILLLPGLTIGLAGSLQLLMGSTGYKFLQPLVAGIAALMIIILIFPVLDWPLRQLAGVEAARVLHIFGLAPRLTIVSPENDPQLILQTGDQAFRVATACNGFGIITSGAMLALLAGGISRRPLWIISLLMLFALPFGFSINLLRILAITQLAPFFPGHYEAMHEVVGTLMLWTGLGFIGWLSWRPDASSVLPTTPENAKV